MPPLLSLSTFPALRAIEAYPGPHPVRVRQVFAVEADQMFRLRMVLQGLPLQAP